MRKNLLFLLFQVFTFTFLVPAFAQTKDSSVKVKSFSANINADMFTAVTVLNIELYNSNNKVLDGEYNFSLQSGQIITGFALDINGFMREGVIVDKQKGRVAYENTIRRRIDPGLLEKTTGNNYRVRVYPVPANGTRRIRIVISEQLLIQSNALQYNLPIDINSIVNSFSVSINSNSSEMPLSNEGLLAKLNFKKDGTNYTLQHSLKNNEILKSLSFRIPLPEISQIICTDKAEESTRFAMHFKPSLQSISTISFSSATVFWDVSSSAAKRDIKKDIDFLETFIDQQGVQELTIVTFSNTIHEKKIFQGKGIKSAMRRFLQSQILDGGTQLGSLDCNQFGSEVFLLFSDGLSNFGNNKISTNGKPVHCINSSSSASHSLLEKIASYSGGRYIDLSKRNVQEAIIEFTQLQKKLMQVTADGKTIQLNVDLPLVFDDWVTLSGSVSNLKGTIDLSFGDNGKIIKTESISLNAESKCRATSIDTVRLLQRYEQIQNSDNESDLLTFAKQERVVTAATSFIVLDNLNDYIQYGIEPPSDLWGEYMKQTNVIKQREEQQKIEEANAIINNLRKSVVLYNERINWWGSVENQISLKEVERKNKERLLIASNADVDKSIVEKAGNSDNSEVFKLGNENSLSEVVVVGYGTQQRRDLTGSVSTISGSSFSNSSATNVQQLLQGRVAGVQVTQASGMPGVAPQVLIRGARSLSGNGEPLYVLDGIPIDGEFASLINVHDIESVTVYKDIQASVLYGSRATNGAIVITTKSGYRNTNQYKQGVAKYKNLEDVEYVTELKEAGKDKIYANYLQMKDSLGKEPSFYFDVAELLFNAGNKEKALRVLSNLAEINNENHQLLRAMGYMLENWAMYEEAIDVYKKVLKIKEEEPQSYRDLALAYEKNGEHQQAVDLLYNSLTKNWFQYEDRYRGLKSLLLNEMNGIINLHWNKLDLSKINGGIIKPLPVDIRIVVDWNKDETDIDLHIIEPGGEECFYSHKLTKSGGRLSEDFTQGYGPEEYQIKEAKKGTYAIRVNYYGDRYQKEQIPSFIKLTIYKNFGKPNQSFTVESLIMDNQTGVVEIGDLKW